MMTSIKQKQNKKSMAIWLGNSTLYKGWGGRRKWLCKVLNDKKKVVMWTSGAKLSHTSNLLSYMNFAED